MSGKDHNQTQHSRKNSSSNHNKRSRGHGVNSTISNQLVNFAKAGSDLKKSSDDSRTTGLKRQRILRPDDLSVFVLQVNPELRKKSIIELAEHTNQYGTEKWVQALFAEALKENNPAACEIKDEEYVFDHPEVAELPDLTDVAVAMRPAATQLHQSRQNKHENERIALRNGRRQIVNRMFNTISPELNSQVVSEFSNFMNAPNIGAVKERIITVFDLEYFDGRKEDLEQQVMQAMTDYFTGQIALSNLAKNGSLNLAAYKRVLEQLLRFRKTTGQPDMLDREKAKYFIYGLGTIKYLSPSVEEYKVNEILYGKLSKNTPEEIDAANAFRTMPMTLQSAYDKMAAVKDLGYVFKDDLLFKRKLQSTHDVQRSSVKDENNEKKKQKVKKQECLICKDKNKGTHDTANCRLLPAAILALQVHKDATSKKASEDKPAVNNTKLVKKYTQKVNTVIDDESDNEADDSLIRYIQAYQQSNRVFVPENFNYWDGSDQTLAQFDNGCSESVQEFYSVKGLTGHKIKEDDCYKIITTNGTKIINHAVTLHVKGFGKCLYNPKAQMHLISQSYCETHYRVEAVKHGNRTLAYKVYLGNYGVVLTFHRQPCGIYVGSLRELLDKKWQDIPEYYHGNPKNNITSEEEDESLYFQRKSVKLDDETNPEEYKENDIANAYTILAITKNKAKVADSDVIKVKEKHLYDYALNVVQPNLGFVAPRVFEQMVNKGMVVNLPDIPANAIRVATEKLGPSMITVKAKTKANHKKANLTTYKKNLGKDERFVHVDFIFLHELVFLLLVSWPGYFNN